MAPIVRTEPIAPHRARGRYVGLRPWAGVDDPVVVGEDDRGGPVADSELGEDRADVALDRRLADEQGGGDLGVRRPACHVPQDVVLPLGELVDP